MTHPPELRARARHLRRRGWSLRRIAHELGIGLSTASLWTRDDAPPAEERVDSATDRAVAPVGVTRRCGRCLLDLDESLFSNGPDGKQAWCKPCFKAYRAARRARAQAQTNARRAWAARYVLDLLERSSCADCGLADVLVLEFDHVRGVKRTELARLVNGGASRASLDAEIAKCDVVCVNCHRRRTRSRAAPRRAAPLAGEVRGRDAIRDGLRGGCVECGERDVDVLDFDHRADKRHTISAMPRGGYSVASIRAEIAKCEVRCGNCHRRRTVIAAGTFRAVALRAATSPRTAA